MKSFNESEIIQGCKDNDRRCQEALYRNFYGKMYRMCFRYTQDEDRLISIVNDGFLRVFKQINKYEGKGSFEGWIRRIVFHSISDHFRKDSRYLKFLIFEERDSNFKSQSLSQLYFDDLLTLIQKLPDKTQAVFTLFAIEGYTHEEIGKSLGMSSGTSKWHVSEARKKLKAALKNLSKEIKHA